MDFLLIVVAIGGLVVAIVMLVLAARVNRLQKESDERVDTLAAMATGSVLFAHTAGDDPVFEPAMVSEPAAPLPPLTWPPPANDLDLALNEFADEEELAPAGAATEAEPQVVTGSPFAVPATAAYPFVMTVPAAAGMGRAQVSFERSRSRSRP
jgi:hypothetical protein